MAGLGVTLKKQVLMDQNLLQVPNENCAIKFLLQMWIG